MKLQSQIKEALINCTVLLKIRFNITEDKKINDQNDSLIKQNAVNNYTLIAMIERNYQVINLSFSRQQFKREGVINFSKVSITQGGVSFSQADCNYMVNSKPINEVRKLRLTVCEIKALAIKELAQGNWVKLYSLTICNNNDIRINLQFGDAECRQLAKLTADGLEKIDLSLLNIGADCLALKNAKWTKLKKLYLHYNKIGDQGCGYISRANWNIVELKVQNNQICANGVRYLSIEHWPQLRVLNLYNNKIGQVGCKWLCQAKWYNLKQLNLVQNNISNAGCKWLSKAKWKKLTIIHLHGNKLYWEGYHYLSICNWPNIKNFPIQMEADDYGLLKLMQSKWKSSHLFFYLRQTTNIKNVEHIKQLWERKYF